MGEYPYQRTEYDYGFAFNQSIRKRSAVWSDYAGWKTALCVWFWDVFACV